MFFTMMVTHEPFDLLIFRRREQMIKAFNSIKEILLAIYQVLFVEAKERYEVTEFYLEKCCRNEKARNPITK